jgi:DNA-binding MarR family transcriptional regulator
MDQNKRNYHFNMFLNLIRATYLNVEKEWQMVAGEVQLGYAQQHALWILHVQDGLTLEELGNIAIWNKSTTSSLISKLEKRGFVEKGPTQDGTRTFKIYITDKGRNILEQSVSTKRSEEFFELFKEYSEEELIDFLDKLRKVCDMVGKSGHEDFNRYLEVYSKKLIK